MAAKRDMVLVRLACKWRWLSAEEGEDVLFLKRKFGNKLTIEEIMRRRGYLDDNEIEELATAADESLGIERPKTDEVRPTVDPRGESREVTILNAPTAFVENPLATIMGGRSLLEEVKQGLEEQRARERPTDDVSPMPVMPQIGDGERTMIAPLPDAVRAARLKQRMDSGEGPTATNLDRDELLADADVVLPADLDEDDSENDQTQFMPRIVAPSVLAESNAVTPRPGAVPPPPELPMDALQPLEPHDDRPPIGFTPEESIGFDIDVEEEEDDDDLLEARSVSILAHIDDPRFAANPLQGIVLSEPLDGADTQDAYQLDPLQADDAAAETLLGDFGPYRLDRIVARGTRSVVYLAEHEQSGHQLAIKVLTGDPRECANFIAERGEDMLAAAPIKSGNVVRIVDVGRVDARYYVALDYIDGWTLAEKLDAGERPSPLESLSIARDVTRALADAEAAGVVHKDVRPGNVLLAGDRAYLTGFGFAKVTDGLEGSMAFLAPERYQGIRPFYATDLYSVGVMLYRLLTGVMPFPGEDGRSIAAAAASLVPPDVRAYDPSIPQPVAELVLRLLSRDPAMRGPSCAAVADLLDQMVFDLEAAGILAADAAVEPPPMKPLAIRTALFAAGGLLAALGLPALLLLVADMTAFLLDTALLGAVLSIVATVLLATVALIRRGEIPLPMSSAWLVRVEEGAGALGTAFLVAGLVIAPPAILNLFVSFLAGIVLVSWVFGVMLRRAVAAARDDGGVGRMLAVLGDPTLSKWRVIHAPLLSSLTCLATVRFMLLAYFSAS